MEVKPKTDVLNTTDALGCTLVHKKGDVVRNFLFLFIKRRVKDDIIRVLFEGDMTRKEFNEYFKEFNSEKSFQVYGWKEEDGVIYRLPFVLIRMCKGVSYRKVCDTVEQCVEFIEMVKDSKEDFLDLELVVN